VCARKLGAVEFVFAKCNITQHLCLPRSLAQLSVQGQCPPVGGNSLRVLVLIVERESQVVGDQRFIMQFVASLVKSGKLGELRARTCEAGS